jgi:hypothetical protein
MTYILTTVSETGKVATYRIKGRKRATYDIIEATPRDLVHALLRGVMAEAATPDIISFRLLGDDGHPTQDLLDACVEVDRWPPVFVN